ncbi:GNAT family N-acetyltransferase [Ornithinibacillus sp. BX22]|uniref:GNAT family N-acetyltransferase n=1 Tax=Ornithinibacillus hominis TaxID=2763055 RepID=A0A923RKT8_9BACI|nr:GNAT family N-acetyltransferase [Ornithinibacillus hominis]
MEQAEEEAMLSKDRIVKPIHIFVSCMQEKGGALGELWIKLNLDFKECSVKEEETEIKPIKNDFFNALISQDTANVLQRAIDYMKGYNQIFLNEGHVLRALIVTKALDDVLNEESKQIIMTHGTTSRDMATNLEYYTFPSLDSLGIKKAIPADEKQLVSFVEQHFSKELAETIGDAFDHNESNVYIAVDDSKAIIGFAAFDVYKRKKGYFGPMGVIHSNRAKGIGYRLLHHCLRDMKELGYAYAIIGGAGPIEFYEKACQAVVIPTASK